MVYVTQEVQGKNLFPAKEFGELKVLLPEGQIALSPGPSIYRLRQKLLTYCDDDYLVLIGDPVACALAAMVAASFNNGKVNFLKWDRQHKGYMPIKADINQTLSI